MNKPASRALAFDFGASSGRAIVGTFDGEKLTLNETHRFSNDPVEVCQSLHWDVLRLFHEIKQGINKTVNSEFKDFDSIGIDTWGVDFGLLDKDGKLLENPYHYRDTRTIDIDKDVFSIVPKKEIYMKTGIQFLWFNTIFQLYSMVKNRADVLGRAETMLMMPDLLNYFLTGVKSCEFTNATTTQLFNPVKGDWDYELIEKLGIPKKIFRNVADPGTKVGTLLPKLAEELGCGEVDIISVASHDTGSAVAAVPVTEEKNFAYISSGTWSLMGMELDKPFISEKSLELNFTNEGGVNRTTRFLKNIMGLWIIQETRRQWEREGTSLSFAQIEEMTRQARPFKAFIDPDDITFGTPGNMPKRINEYLKRTGQSELSEKGEIARCVMESLAMKYRLTLEGLEKLSGKRIECIHVIGGGVKDKLLCQLTASASGRPVIAGPVEATAIGNLVVQFMAEGKIKDLRHARQVIKNSFPVETYEPVEQEKWDKEYERFKEIIAKGAAV